MPMRSLWHGLPKNIDFNCIRQRGDVPFFAKKWKLGTEAAARRLRYDLFRAVLAEGSAEDRYSAHSMTIKPKLFCCASCGVQVHAGLPGSILC